MGSRRWPATDDFGPSSDPHPLVKSGCCSVTQMARNGRSEMTPVPWILILAFILHHPSHATSLPPAPAQLGTSWCVDNGCSEQFQGLGGCVNLAAPLQISKLSKRFDLGATSLKGLCGSVGLLSLYEASSQFNRATNSWRIKTSGKKTFCKEAWSKETNKTQTKETQTNETKAKEIQVKETQVKETKIKETEVKEAQFKEIKVKETKAKETTKSKKKLKLVKETEENSKIHDFH